MPGQMFVWEAEIEIEGVTGLATVIRILSDVSEGIDVHGALLVRIHRTSDPF